MTVSVSVAKWFLRCPNCNGIREFHEVREGPFNPHAHSSRLVGLRCQKCGYLKPRLTTRTQPLEIKREYMRRAKERYLQRKRKRQRFRWDFLSEIVHQKVIRSFEGTSKSNVRINGCAKKHIYHEPFSTKKVFLAADFKEVTK